VVKTLDDLKVTLKLALSEANGPDVAQVNQGRSDMGAMVEAGLLLPLDSYLAKYNWGSVFSTSVASRNSFTPDGKTFGRAIVRRVSPNG
jgi:raffinose/stachyose/melibiose transport system substrate-binding protein